MGMTAHLKQISTSTLELLKQDAYLVDFFLDITWFYDSSFSDRKIKIADKFKGDTGKVIEQQLFEEWEVPDLDLHKYYDDLTFLLAGYHVRDDASQFRSPEIQAYCHPDRHDFP